MPCVNFNMRSLNAVQLNVWSSIKHNIRKTGPVACVKRLRCEHQPNSHTSDEPKPFYTTKIASKSTS